MKMTEEEDPLPVVIKRLNAKQEKIENGEELTKEEREQLQADYERLNDVLQDVIEPLVDLVNVYIKELSKPIESLAETFSELDADTEQ